MRKSGLFKTKLEELYEKRFPPTFERENPFNGKMEIMPSGVTNDSNVSALFCSEMLSIIVEAKNDLLNNPSLFSYEEIQVPDAWHPWFEKWFGVDLKKEEMRRL